MRRRLLFAIAFALLAAALPSLGQTPANSPSPSPFTLEFDPNSDITSGQSPTGEQGIFFTVRFKIIRHGGAGDVGTDYKVVVELDGHEIQRLDVPQPKISEELSAVLAVDVSGSMGKEVVDAKGAKSKRIDQAREAATAFIKGLPSKADCGLILFDHEIEPKLSPKVERGPLLKVVAGMQERGGTAYLDAAKEGVNMLAQMKAAKGRKKAVVIMTDGVDLNSTTTLGEVIKLAQAKDVKIYTIGIGEPGTGKPVTSVLALDRSQSMELPADKNDPRPKIAALHNAASRFVELMPATAKTTVLAFGSTLDPLGDFTKDKRLLYAKIQSLTPQGETAMLDAAYDAVATLAALPGDVHRAVVVMTDGIDNTSRHRPEDVIQRAKEKKISLHMLAFGKEEELRQAKDDMVRMARGTGGTYHHARNEKDLIRIFEDMSNALHDDGIDVAGLTRLAEKTGGKYRHVRKISELRLILDEVSQDLQEKQYSLTFPNPRGHDGSVHGISIKLVDTSGRLVVEKTGGTAVRGVVVAEMNPLVYLGLLAILGLMLAIPTALGSALRPKA